MALGLGLVKPHINSGITSGVPVNASLPTGMHLPNAPLDWTVLPDVKIGYRFAGSQDELRVRYQGLFSQGRQFFADFDAWGSGVVLSRLDFNMIDVDYVCASSSTGPWARRRRGSWTFCSACARGISALTAGGFGSQVIFQSMRNSFAGIGPHIGMDYSRSLFGPASGGTCCWTRRG